MSFLFYICKTTCICSIRSLIDIYYGDKKMSATKKQLTMNGSDEHNEGSTDEEQEHMSKKLKAVIEKTKEVIECGSRTKLETKVITKNTIMKDIDSVVYDVSK